LSFESNAVKQYLPYKMAVNTAPMKSNTRGGAAIDLFGRFTEVKANWGATAPMGKERGKGIFDSTVLYMKLI
jgi:hypothetical protein